MRSKKQKNSPVFLSPGRDNSKLRREYLKVKEGAENVYTPKFHLVHSDLARFTKINPKRTVQSRKNEDS